MKEEDNMEKSTWTAFRDSGLLWMINSTLHVFGWVIAIETNEDGEFVGASPYKTNFRGFSNDVNDKGYKKVTNYMENNIQRLVNAVEEE